MYIAASGAGTNNRLFTGYGKVLQLSQNAGTWRQEGRYATISCGGGKNKKKKPIPMPKDWRLLWRSGHGQVLSHVHAHSKEKKSSSN